MGAAVQQGAGTKRARRNQQRQQQYHKFYCHAARSAADGSPSACPPLSLQIEGEPIEKPHPLAWYPGNMARQMNFSRAQVRRARLCWHWAGMGWLGCAGMRCRRVQLGVPVQLRKERKQKKDTPWGVD